MYDFFEARPLASSIIAIVGTISLAHVFRKYRAYWADQRYATSKGCGDLKVDRTRWPLGLDVVIEAYREAKKERILRWFMRMCQRNGTTFAQHILGQRAINTNDPRNVEALLSTQFEDFGIGERSIMLGPLLGDGIFTQDGLAWKHSREMLRPQFMGNRVRNFTQIQEHADNLIASIPEGKPMDLQPLFFRYTLDTTTVLLFGKSIYSLKIQDDQAQEIKFAEAFNKGQDGLAERSRLGPLYWLFFSREFKRACHTVHSFIDDIVNNALSDGYIDKKPEDGGNYAFIDALVKETRDPIVIRNQLIHILLAGRDSTACYLSWTFRLLARHQPVLDRLREEIETTLGLGEFARSPDRNELKKMRYLGFVLKEVLRLYPPVPSNARFCVKTTTLPVGGGPDGKSPILVRKGEPVAYTVFVIHRSKELYGEDADLFRPERWDPSADNKVDLKNIGWGYLPFNGGPRVCLGQDFALLEASYAIVRLIQKYPYLKVPDGDSGAAVGDEKQALSLVMSSGEGCWITMTS